MNQRDSSLIRPMVLLTIICSVVAGYLEYRPQQDAIVWSALDEAQRAAFASNKPVFVDVYASWCKPCITMDRVVFANDSLRQKLSTRFMLAKVNIDDPVWGDTVRKKFAIVGLPTYLILSPKGKEWDRRTGTRFGGNSLLAGFTDWISDSTRTLVRQWMPMVAAQKTARTRGTSLMVLVVQEPSNVEWSSIMFESDTLWRALNDRITPTYIGPDSDDKLRARLPLLPEGRPQVLLLDRKERLLGAFYLEESMRVNDLELLERIKKYLPAEDPELSFDEIVPENN